MASKISSFGKQALLLFSGDALSPSLLSTMTQGKQMIEALNCFGVDAACVGNHDFDHGLEEFTKRRDESSFPWLMANVLDNETGQPLGGALPSLVLEWHGVRVGLVGGRCCRRPAGLVEQEWLETLSSIDPDEVTYKDFVEEGTRVAAELRAQGAEVVLALTHMRLPNDLRLASGVPGLDAVLGGHDHEPYLMRAEGTGIPVIKSGTDFQYLTEISIALEPAAPGAAAEAAVAGASPVPRAAAAAAQPQTPTSPASPGSRTPEVPPLAGTLLRCVTLPPGSPTPACGSAEAQSATDTYVAAADASVTTELDSCRAAGGDGGSGVRVRMRCVRHPITSDLPEGPAAKEIEERYAKLMGEKMDVVVGSTATDLDGRFAAVRTGESNLGNFIGDVWRDACSADVALLNGGTLRSNRIHPAGELTHRVLVAILPMIDDTVKIQVTGAQLLASLENGVSEWPKHEGRFPQVSGLRFAFDPTCPPGQRVVEGSGEVGGTALQLEAEYSLETKKYLAEGRDGYDVLAGAPLLCDVDCTPLLAQVIANHFLLLRTMNRYVDNTGRMPAWRRAAERLLAGSKTYASKSQQRLQASGVSHTVRKHPVTGHWQIAPVLDGRIKRVGGGSSASLASSGGA
ncbi:5 -C-terminal domain-containing [Micractinium conductrix]|uniref:5 -C-terminal domain-containing n=1 Tax=Micractinium conductrix TaxID=554055 RepID=A0A2P6VKG3_9CHLO|nr:5 -C-terminal domain-containing [Micractinium conductrix]|eukprot:PSC74575.1 5 -C-terminal domain-containing [Micractinium conductrix]